jgi:hypothetical protein
MTEMRGVLIAAIVLLSIPSLSPLGQMRGRGQRRAPAQGPGNVVAPEAGYVTPPEPTPAGTVYAALIPPDEFDRAYWELFDRDKHVTISGQVTKVDWTNPNTYIFVKAGAVEWAVEASFIQFRQSNVTPAVRANQTISIAGYLAKDDPNPKWPVKS